MFYWYHLFILILKRHIITTITFVTRLFCRNYPLKNLSLQGLQKFKQTDIGVHSSHYFGILWRNSRTSLQWDDKRDRKRMSKGKIIVLLLSVNTIRNTITLLVTISLSISLTLSLYLSISLSLSLYFSISISIFYCSILSYFLSLYNSSSSLAL